MITIHPIMRNLCIVLILTILLLAITVTDVVSQDTNVVSKGTDTTTVVSSRSTGGKSVLAEQAFPPIRVMGENGKTSFVLIGYTPEDIEELLNTSKNPRELPSFSIQDLDIDGRITEEKSTRYAQLTVRLKIVSRFGSTVKIPLKMKEGVFLFSKEGRNGAGNSSDFQNNIDNIVKYQGNGSCLLTVDPLDGQYVVLIQSTRQQQPKAENRVPTPSEPEVSSEGAEEENSESSEIPEPERVNVPESTIPSENNFDQTIEQSLDQHHYLELELCFPLSKLGTEENRLLISFPQTVRSNFRLYVPIPEAVLSEAKGVARTERVDFNETTTRFEMQGLAGNFEIAWQKKQEEKAPENPILQVEKATIFAQLNNSDTEYEAVLPVRVQAGVLPKFMVKLPEDARWIPDESTKSEYTIRELPKDANEKSVTLEVTPQTAASPDALTVRLKATKSIPPEQQSAWRDIHGFEVIGAEKQYGVIEIGIPSEMRPNLRPLRRVRQIETSEATAQEGVAAEFEFFSQPFLLRAQASKPQTRIRVTPEYQIQVNKGLTLKGTLSYMVHGQKAEQLTINMKDWPRVKIGPDTVVDNARIASNNGVWTVPLLVPTDGPIDLTLEANRDMPNMEENQVRLAIELPKAVDANWMEPAAVVIVPADNLELSPLEGSEIPEEFRIKGMSRAVRRSVTPKIEIPVRRQDPLIYRMDSPDARFVTDIIMHSQQIRVLSQADVKLLDSEDQVTQSLVYSVDYEPLRILNITVPKAIDVPDRLRFTVENMRVKVLSSENDPENPKNVKKRLELSEYRSGNFELKIRYSFPAIEIPPQMTTQQTIPLIVPDDGTLTDQIVNISVGSGVQTNLPDDKEKINSWVSSDLSGNFSLRSPVFQYRASEPETEIPLDVRLEDRGVLGTAEVERAWIQTWLLSENREDRIAYRFTSEKDAFYVNLPKNVISGRVAVLLDDVPISVQVDRGKLVVPLNPEQNKKTHTLDIWYQVRGSEYTNSRSIDLPQLDPEVWVRRMYWQVVLPESKHILGSSPGWTSEYHWKWNGWFWERTPTLSQKDVGIWVDSKQVQTLSIPTETNIYLFSSLQPPVECQFYVVDRGVMVLLSSGVFLLVGLLLIYIPKLRYPGVLFVLVIAAFTSIVYRPAVFLVLLEAGILGIVLALFAAMLYRIFCRNEAWTVPSHSSSAFSRNRISALTENLPSVIVEEESIENLNTNVTKNERGLD